MSELAILLNDVQDIWYNSLALTASQKQSSTFWHSSSMQAPIGEVVKTA